MQMAHILLRTLASPEWQHLLQSQHTNDTISKVMWEYLYLMFTQLCYSNDGTTYQSEKLKKKSPQIGVSLSITHIFFIFPDKKASKAANLANLEQSRARSSFQLTFSRCGKLCTQASEQRFQHPYILYIMYSCKLGDICMVAVSFGQFIHTETDELHICNNVIVSDYAACCNVSLLR